MFLEKKSIPSLNFLNENSYEIHLNYNNGYVLIKKVIKNYDF